MINLETGYTPGVGSAIRRRIFGFLLRKVSSQLYEDWVTHACDWTLPGFRALAVHRFGARLRTDQKRGVLNRTLSILYRIMYRYVRNHYGIELPASTIVGRRFHIPHQGGIVVHPNSVFGDDCAIVANITIGASGRRRLWDAPKFGNRVVIGAGATIIGKVVVGDDVNIGPNATVLTNIPSGTTVCAPPPRLLTLSHRHSQKATLSSTQDQESLASKE